METFVESVETFLEVILLFLGFVFLFGNKGKKKPYGKGAIVHRCSGGLEGHERRVAEFYGEDFDEELARRREWQRKIDSGEIKLVKVPLRELLNEKSKKGKD